MPAGVSMPRPDCAAPIVGAAASALAYALPRPRVRDAAVPPPRFVLGARVFCLSRRIPGDADFGTLAIQIGARVTSSPRHPLVGQTSDTAHSPLLTKSVSPRTRMPSTT